MSTLVLLGSHLTLAFVNPDDHQGKLTESATLSSNPAPATTVPPLANASASASLVNSTDDHPVIWHSVNPKRTNTSQLWKTMPRDDAAPDEAADPPPKDDSTSPAQPNATLASMVHSEEATKEPTSDIAKAAVPTGGQGGAKRQAQTPPTKHAVLPADESACVDDPKFSTIRYLGEGMPLPPQCTTTYKGCQGQACAACDLWLDAGYTCDTVFSDVCSNDNPEGAKYNDFQLKQSGCLQCSPSPPPLPPSAPPKEKEAPYCCKTLELSNPGTPDGALARVYGVYEAKKGSPGVYVNVRRCPLFNASVPPPALSPALKRKLVVRLLVHLLLADRRTRQRQEPSDRLRQWRPVGAQDRRRGWPPLQRYLWILH